MQTERSEVCTSDGGQDSPIQTDLARLIRCLLYGQTKTQKGKKKIFVPLRGLKHLAGLLLSKVSSPNGTKITVQIPASVCTNFVNEWRKNNRSFHTRSMKHFPKVHQILMPVCGSIAHSSLQSSTDHHRKMLMLNVQSSNLSIRLMCSGKNYLRLDLLDGEDISLCCSGSTN